LRNDRVVTQHRIRTAQVAPRELSASSVGRRSELERQAKNGWSPWCVSQSQLALAKQDLAPLMKNSDLLIEKANSIGPDQTACEAGVSIVQFSLRSKDVS
jgi:hypothetical protein